MLPPEESVAASPSGYAQQARGSILRASAVGDLGTQQDSQRRSSPISPEALNQDNVDRTGLDSVPNANSDNNDGVETEITDIDAQELSPRASSPTDDEKLESSTDLQFKKKDFRKSRAQLFQLVLLTASLKSLKQQSIQGNPPQLLRNHSSVSNIGTANSKNFQLFIQAPVLSSVTNLRLADEVEIGQQLPFDHRTEPGSMFPDLAKISNTDDVSPQNEDDDEDDIYKEETTLQQQRLTINALKKLSLSLAPIIRLDEDDIDLQPRQLTTKLLNGSVVPDLRMKLKPYQPAQVDLSSFSSLTRQSKFLEGDRAKQEQGHSQAPTWADAQRQHQTQTALRAPLSQGLSVSTNHLLHGKSSALTQSQGLTQPNSALENGLSLLNQNKMNAVRSNQNFNLNSNLNSSLNSHPNANQNAKLDSISKMEDNMQDRGRWDKQDPRSTQVQVQNITKGPAVSINGFKPFGNIEHTIGGRNTPGYPVVPPHNMNIRNRKVSIQHEPQPPTAKHPLPDKKLQQIKGFRSPGYVPAVLRRTAGDDRDVVGPISSNGLDPEQTENVSSLPNTALPAKDTGSSADSVRSFDLAYSSESIQPGLLKTGPYTLNKRQYEHILKAAPTRKHWLKDESVAECGLSTCHKHFNFFERRHHCRKCGGIFCKDHTSHYLYINHLAQFTTGGRGTLSRVCDNCIEEYNEFMKTEFGVGYQTPRSRQSPPSNSETNDYRKEIFKPKTKATAQPVLLPISPVTKLDMNEQLVGSVPANWSWLSF